MSYLNQGAVAALAVWAAMTSPAGAQGLERGKAGRNDALVLNDGARIELPACADAQGRAVRYVMARRPDATPVPGAGAGEWTIVSIFSPAAGPQILMRPPLLDLPRETLQFVVEHECYHHESGDVYAAFLGGMRNDVTVPDLHDMEYRADCAAVRAVQRKYGFTADDIRKAFGVFPAHDHSATHPPTADRTARAVACLAAPSIP